MRKSDSIQKLMTALGSLQAECIKVRKDSTNPHFKSKYASLSVILDEIQPMLTKHQLAYTQIPEDGRITTLLMHTVSGEWIESDYNLNAQQQTPQAVGSAITYARRYSLTATLGLNIDDDDDGNAANEPAKQKAPAQQQQAPAPPVPTTPFNKAYADSATLLAALSTATTKQEMLTLYTANKATIDAHDHLKEAFKKQDTKIANGGKVIITDAQMKQVCARLVAGELAVYEQAKGAYLLNENQTKQLQDAYEYAAKLEEALKVKQSDEAVIVNIMKACVTSAQVLRLHSNNALVIDRTPTLVSALEQRLKELNKAA